MKRNGTFRKKSRKTIQINTNFDVVKITKHFHERYEKRTKSKISYEKLLRETTNRIHESRLLSLSGNQEIRCYKGLKYVCKREKQKDGQEYLVIVTLKLGNSRQREYFSNDLSYENIDYKAINM